MLSERVSQRQRWNASNRWTKRFLLCLCGSRRTQLTEFARAVSLHLVSLLPALAQTRLLISVWNRHTGWGAAMGPLGTFHPNYTTRPLESSPYPFPGPLTFLEHTEVVRRAGWLAVGDPGGFDDLFQGIGGFTEDDLAWSVEVTQRVRVIWLLWGRHLSVGRVRGTEGSPHAVGSLARPSVRPPVRVVEVQGEGRGSLGRALQRQGPSILPEVFPQPRAVF